MKRDLYIYGKRPMYIWREANSYERQIVEMRLTCVRKRRIYMKRDPYVYEKRPICI